MATAAEEAKGEAQQRGDGGGTTTQEKHDAAAAAALVGAPAQPAALSVRLWRRTVVPCIRPLLRLAMRSTVSTAHSMVCPFFVCARSVLCCVKFLLLRYPRPPLPPRLPLPAPASSSQNTYTRTNNPTTTQTTTTHNNQTAAHAVVL
jgi:hypothetical protein